MFVMEDRTWSSELVPTLPIDFQMLLLYAICFHYTILVLIKCHLFLLYAICLYYAILVLLYAICFHYMSFAYIIC